MLNVSEAIKIILNNINVLSTEEASLLKSTGRVAAEDLYAAFNVPGFDSSVMDGYAVRSTDTQGAGPQSPRILRVVGNLKAGAEAKYSVSTGTAVRIMTGAPIPAGSDCVAKFEDTDTEKRQPKKSLSKEIGIIEEIAPGANIRKAGGSVPTGSQILSQGSVIGPAEIGLLASQGHISVKVIRRPVIAIIATGEELVPLSRNLNGPGIFNDSSYSLAAQVLRCGGLPQIVGIARDNRLSLISKISRGMSADLVITTGGTSRGDYDMVKDIMAELGEIVFQQVKMMPGRSFAMALLYKSGPGGKTRQVPHMALTGNPAAGMVNFEVLVRPAILKMAGLKDTATKTVAAIMENSVDYQSEFRRYIWVKLSQRDNCYYALTAASLTRGVLPSIALADGLAIISEKISQVKAGDRLPVMLLDWR